MFEVIEGDQLQPYMDAIELEGNAAQPMEEAGVEEEKASRTIAPRAFRVVRQRSACVCGRCGVSSVFVRRRFLS